MKAYQINVGDKYNRLTVISEPYRLRSRAVADCKCDCGKIRIGIRVHRLVNGETKSCGCWSADFLTSRILKHGCAGGRHRKRDKLYKIWRSMRDRCYYPRKESYPRYGGRGITVCDEWESFAPFRDWANANGYTDGLQIDRIDNDGNYEPSNCRWATNKQQSRNKSTNTLVSAFGETKCAAEWAEDSRCLASYPALLYRIQAGWNPETAITTARTR